MTVFVPSADRHRDGPNRIIGNVIKVVGQKYKIMYFLTCIQYNVCIIFLFKFIVSSNTS